MYYEKEKDRIRTMLCGTPLTAEELRMSQMKLGAEWWGTSYFFVLHILAKGFTQNETIGFDALYQLVENYGIDLWTDKDHLRKKLDDFLKAFRRTGLGSIHKTENDALTVDKVISNAEFRDFAAKEYEYAMGEGLVRIYPSSWEWGIRTVSNFAERILWHYITRVFDSPRVYSSPSGDNELVSLYTDITETMQKTHFKFHGISPWEDISPHTLSLIQGWERNLISKNALKPFPIGDVLFVAPSFFSTIDWRKVFSGGKFSAEKQELVVELVENLRKTPAYPILKGQTEEYELAKGLQRAGVVKIVEESKVSEISPYAYLVARDVFEDVDGQMGYQYSQKPFKEFGDSTLTELVFRSLGRARLFGEQVLPGLKQLKIEYKPELTKIFDDLEQKKSAMVPQKVNSGIFDPLASIGIVSQKDKQLVVDPKYSPIIKRLADYWNNLINDPSISHIEFPPKETVDRKEHAQVEGQIKKRLGEYF
jgi:hypothetical protein